MLLKFTVENYLSIREKQELSLVATGGLRSGPTVALGRAGHFGVLPAAAIYGANAAGKTNVLAALAFAAAAVRFSQTNWPANGGVPRVPFRLDPRWKMRPTAIEFDLWLDGARHTYGFEADDERVLREWLDDFPNGRRRMRFTRDGGRFEFGRGFGGALARKVTRGNSLYLSAAAQSNQPEAKKISGWFTDGVAFVMGPRLPGPGEFGRAVGDSKVAAEISQALAGADLGITGFRMKSGQIDKEYMAIYERIRRAVPEAELPASPEANSLAFAHRAEGGPVEIELGQESAGTVSYLGLLLHAREALARGAVLCVDEIERALHPLLAGEVVRFFQDPRRNRSGAQLVFNTHDTNLLSGDLLRRDQVWFTEKDRNGATHLYPLTDFKPRGDESLAKGYLQGRYGALPFLGELGEVLLWRDGNA